MSLTQTCLPLFSSVVGTKWRELYSQSFSYPPLSSLISPLLLNQQDLDISINFFCLIAMNSYYHIKNVTMSSRIISRVYHYIATKENWHVKQQNINLGWYWAKFPQSGLLFLFSFELIFCFCMFWLLTPKWHYTMGNFVGARFTYFTHPILLSFSSVLCLIVQLRN